jgi:hypothetical protein
MLCSYLGRCVQSANSDLAEILLPQEGRKLARKKLAVNEDCNKNWQFHEV